MSGGGGVAVVEVHDVVGGGAVVDVVLVAVVPMGVELVVVELVAVELAVVELVDGAVVDDVVVDDVVVDVEVDVEVDDVVLVVLVVVVVGSTTRAIAYIALEKLDGTDAAVKLNVPLPGAVASRDTVAVDAAPATYGSVTAPDDALRMPAGLNDQSTTML